MTVAALVLAATFVRAMEQVKSLDPIRAQTIYDSSAVQLIYETPLEIDYVARPYRLAPGLCDLPEVSSDGRTYVLRMIPPELGGSPVLNADDIVRSLERLRDPAQASPGGWTMREVESVRALEARTVEIRLRRRFHVFPWMLAMSYAGVACADGSGTGPYRLAGWRKNHELRFERNPAWGGWSGEPGEIDEVRYLFVSDATTKWLMFLGGELDYMQKVSRDNWDAVVGPDGRIRPELAARGIRLDSAPALEVFYVGMNMKDPVLGANRRLRQAISCAFDSSAWREFLNCSVDIADGPVPLGVAGRVEDPFPYAYDLGRAKSLLAEAGYPGGIDPATGRRLVLTLSMGNKNSDGRELGELLASFFARIGIKLELDMKTWGSFLEAVNSGHVQMYFMGWVGDYPDAENFLQMFHSRNVSPGANHSCYVNPEFDAAYDAAMDAPDEHARLECWRRCQELVREDCPWIYAHYQRINSLIRENVRGFVPGDFPYGQEKRLRIEK